VTTENISCSKCSATSNTPVRVKRIGDHALPVPARANATDAGLDLRACFTNHAGPGIDAENIAVKLNPGVIFPFDCGFAMEIPDGYEGVVRGRSGLAFKNGVTAFHVGTIDAGYRGEIRVMLRNDGAAPIEIKHGDRIAQIVIAPVLLASTVEVDDLSSSERGENGYGSSGKT
jgi:dUTP pyrophosphatase